MFVHLRTDSEKSSVTHRRPPRRNNAVRATVFVLCAACALSVAGCRNDDPAAAGGRGRSGGAENGETRQVRTVRVVEMPTSQSIEVFGTLAATDRAIVSLKVPGRVQSFAVDLGSAVRRGQVIARLEPEDYQLRAQQAEAALWQARTQLGLMPEGAGDRVDSEQTGAVSVARAAMDEARIKRERAAASVEQGAISRAEFDATDAAYKAAQGRYQDAVKEMRDRQALLSQRRSELARARQQLADTTVRAPFDGVIQEKLASVGEYLGDGDPLVNIVRVNPLRFRAEVPERDAANVRAGQDLRLSVESSESDYTGSVTRLSPAAVAEQNRVIVIEADISNDGALLLRPGPSARAEIVTDEAGAGVSVPTGAIITSAGVEKVFVVENGRAVERPITAGRRAADWTEVMAGINVGDTVVIEPGDLRPGQPVNVIE